jgi:translation initiation factor 2 subunit 1
LSTTWVKNIRDHVREKQKLVLKVLRVDQEKGQVDLTLRRVTNPEKNQKLLQWKKDKKADTILKIAAENLKANESETIKIRNIIIEKYGSLYDAFEETAESGEKNLSKVGLNQKWIEALIEVINSRIKLEKVKVKTTIELASLNPNGIQDIKNVVTNAIKSKKSNNSLIRVYTIGAPKYCIEVSADNYPEAEKILAITVEDILTDLEKSGGIGRRLN